MDIAAAKAALRKDALARRAHVSESQTHAFAGRIAEIGAEFAVKSGAGVVSAFWPIGSEPSTFALIAALARQNIVTALPVMEKKGTPLFFRPWRHGEPLGDARWGIKEPLPEAGEVLPDLLFVPLAAYDKTGNRIGYGAGFYDRTLAKLRAIRSVTAIGVAYDVQEMPSVPAEPCDQRLDFVLTDRRWIVCR